MRGSTGVATIGAVLATVCGIEILAHGPLIDIDRRVAINYWPIGDTQATGLAKLLADIGKPEWACLVVGVLGLALALRHRRWGPALAATVGLGLVGLATLVLKEVFPRTGIWGHPGSFPSGHTGVAVVSAGLVLYLLLPPAPWRERVTLVSAALWGGLMAWGRLIIETHWLSDVIAGWGIGMCVLVIALRMADSPLGTRGWRRSTRVDTQ